MKKYYVYGVSNRFEEPKHLYLCWNEEPQTLDDIVDKIWASDDTIHRISLTDFYSTSNQIANNLNKEISRGLTAVGSRITRFALVLQKPEDVL